MQKQIAPFTVARDLPSLIAQANEPKTRTIVTGTAHGTEIFATPEGPLLQAAMIDFVVKVMP
ncbi:MAG: hypothetical protein R3293_28685 [Candidatus Promineifilaceae bacterium]|nr:hypothetical protein [Candidatus Promineifilaceae bacterium]